MKQGNGDRNGTVTATAKTPKARGMTAAVAVARKEQQRKRWLDLILIFHIFWLDLISDILFLF